MKGLPFLAIALIAPTWTNAEGICWLDKVTKVPDGLEVHFMKNSRVTIYKKGEAVLAEEDGATRQLVKGLHVTLGLEVPVVLAKGQSILVMSGSPEDSCSIKFAEKDGQIGVTAHATNTTGPAGQVVAEMFYLAE